MTHWLALIVDALLLPVIALLFVLLAATLLHFGGFLAEAAQRARGIRPWRDWDPAGRPAQRALAEVQARMLHALEGLSLGIRLGPVLGLAGTLIPLGPALVAFGQGDRAALAGQLAIAFHATVVGLLAGGACFAMQAVRRRWYRMDLVALTERLHA